MIVIDPYHAEWPAEFQSLRDRLAQALHPLALRIDHIGSTAVPGLGAKDVIDLQITVAALTIEVRDRLIQAGYVFFPAITRDHVPLGADPEPALWVKYFYNQPPGHRRANIHVRVAGNANQRYPLLFRDYLRAHPRSAQSIELIKREIAKRHAEDVESYYDIKDPVYDLIWEAAQEWAATAHWQPDREGVVAEPKR